LGWIASELVRVVEVIQAGRSEDAVELLPDRLPAAAIF
jgi:hypothetical protein